MSEFVDEVREYLKKHGIAVTRTEIGGPESAVFHVTPQDRAKASSMQATIERDLRACTAFDDAFGMSVIIVEREEQSE